MTTRTVVKLPVNGKSVSALVGILGSAALLCNVGTSPAALLRGNQPPGAGPDPSGSASLPDIDRADTIMERLLSIPEENDRYLMFGNKALENNYYTQLGDGFCAAADFSLYDHVANPKDSAAECAKFCGKHLLYTEHRGFNYAEHNKDCQCLFDDFRIPRPLQKKSAVVVLAPHGDGKVLHTTLASGDGSGYQCYKKNDETVGGSIDWYNVKDCATDDGEVLDIVSFTAFTSDTCADICGRFSLMRTHRGFTVTIEGHCRCLFKEGEMPTERKLSNSGAERHESLTFQERFGQFITPGETKCYDKTERNQQAPANIPRVQGDASNRVFINEFHFRNLGTNEPFVRVVGPKGTDASNYKLLSYQGRDGAVHRSQQLTGTFESPDGHPHYGYVKVDLDKGFVRNGKQGTDGLALVDASGPGTCVQFVSYASEPDFDRSFEATDGECNGKASVPIGVTEPRDTALGNSLQLSGGEGNNFPAFTWTAPRAASATTANAGQVLTAP